METMGNGREKDKQHQRQDGPFETDSNVNSLSECRRRFLKRMGLAAIGIGAMSLGFLKFKGSEVFALCCCDGSVDPCETDNCDLDNCNTHSCTNHSCSGANTCGSDSCGTDYCGDDSCTSDYCSISDSCFQGNTCGSDHCDDTGAGNDECSKTDNCTASDTCDDHTCLSDMCGSGTHHCWWWNDTCWSTDAA